jgi:hypothetical protein
VLLELSDQLRKRNGLLACSLRVSVVAFVVIVFFFAITSIFLFVFFLVWLVSKEEVGS